MAANGEATARDPVTLCSHGLWPWRLRAPGGPVARLPQFGPAVPKPEGPVLLEDLKERLRDEDPFFAT